MNKINQVLIIGAGGGLGQALVKHYLQTGASVYACSRQAQPDDCGDADWLQLDYYDLIAQGDQHSAWTTLEKPSFDLILSTLGVLHTDQWTPEKHIGALDAEQLSESFQVNSILPILLLQTLLPLLPKEKPCVWAQLSAKVGSIEDNYLGGWYSYRASKAALNMLLKTASIELGRTHKQLCIAAIHPGTTDTQLSKPFQKRLPKDKLYTPETSAERIAQVIAGLSPQQTGKLLHWDGNELPY